VLATLSRDSSGRQIVTVDTHDGFSIDIAASDFTALANLATSAGSFLTAITTAVPGDVSGGGPTATQTVRQLVTNGIYSDAAISVLNQPQVQAAVATEENWATVVEHYGSADAVPYDVRQAVERGEQVAFNDAGEPELDLGAGCGGGTGLAQCLAPLALCAGPQAAGCAVVGTVALSAYVLYQYGGPALSTAQQFLRGSASQFSTVDISGLNSTAGDNGVPLVNPPLEGFPINEAKPFVVINVAADPAFGNIPEGFSVDTSLANIRQPGYAEGSDSLPSITIVANQNSSPSGVDVNISTEGRTPAEAAAIEEYAKRVNEWIAANGPQTIQGTAGDLRLEASAATRQERERAAREGTPYTGQAGHVPDTAITGSPIPPGGWMDMPGVSNNCCGGVLGSRLGQIMNGITVNGKRP
jgi:hypothetical protein